MKLGTKTLSLFSSPAQRYLARLERPRPPSRRAVADKLRVAGRPVFDAAVDFQVRFGGLVFGPPGKREDVQFGIDYRPPRRRSDEPDDPELTLVPIGRAHDEYDLLYMNEQGEVISYVDSVVMKNSSIMSYIEQELVWYTRAWRAPCFYADLRPAMGDRLAERLDLQRIPLVSDAYEVWWERKRVRVQQVLFAGSWKAGHTSVTARSLEDLVHVLRTARAIDPNVRVNLASRPLKAVRPAKRRREQAPSMELWAASPGAERYPFGSDPDVTGVVWIIHERGRPRIQQYRVFNHPGEAPKLRSWTTFTPEGGIFRDMEEWE